MSNADADMDSDSSTSEPVDYTNADGWEDIEPDQESPTFQCLFDETKFQKIDELLKHCLESHNFDFRKIRAAFGTPPAYMFKRLSQRDTIRANNPVVRSRLHSINQACELHPI